MPHFGRVRRLRLARLGAVPAVLVAVAFVATACVTESTPNTFSPGGDVAQKQKDLFELAMWPAIVIFFLVEGALLYALWRYRRRRDGALPKQTHGNTRLEVAWTVAPTLLLAGLAVPMIAGIIDLAKTPGADALELHVRGFQWNWQFEYPQYTDAQGKPLTIIGACPSRCPEVYIPVGRDISVTLEAADVIHSFWVPRLAGKLDAIPGHTNRMWFNAVKLGRYGGQCAEFCGLEHAQMKMTVVAVSEEEFERWVKEQLQQ